MSYKYHSKSDILGVRKMVWDGLWHILYKINGRLTWDRVSRQEALQVAKDIS